MTTSQNIKITTRFGDKSTADEVSEGVDLTGLRAIVTGGASGIGFETTRTLARLGAEVTVAVRNVAAADETIAELRSATDRAVHVAPLELTDAASIAAFADAWDGPLHLLVNNAGVMAIQERTLSPDGWEAQLATNYLGHFRLTFRLHEALARAQGARVVALSSTAHLFSPVVFDDMDFRFRPYDPIQAYAQSKTAVNLFALEATRRWVGDGITVNAVNPGAIATPLQRHIGGRLATPVEMRKSPQQGASTTLLVATSPALDGLGGRYFSDNQEATVVDFRPTNLADLAASVAKYSLDSDNAERLWNNSLPMII